MIASTSTRKRQIRFLIELELKEQFQIAKAGEEYQKIVSCLPEFYVGKAEYLTAIVRVVCDAAKKSMKKKKMHLAPWRKNGFMQMKWSGFNQTYHHHHIQQASESNMGFSRAPNAVVAVNWIVISSIPIARFWRRILDAKPLHYYVGIYASTTAVQEYILVYSIEL